MGLTTQLTGNCDKHCAKLMRRLVSLCRVRLIENKKK